MKLWKWICSFFRERTMEEKTQDWLDDLKKEQEAKDKFWRDRDAGR